MISTKKENDIIIGGEGENERKVIGYIRVSTDEQDSLKQRETIEHHARRLGIKVTRFVRIEISSTRNLEERKLSFLNTLKSGDILICTETSRLSRSLQELLGIVDALLKEGVRIIFIMQGLDITNLDSATTRLTLHIFSMMAEHERRVISERTREALARLKERGVKLGKPYGTIQKSLFDKVQIKEWCRIGLPYSRQAKILDVSRTGLIHYVKTRRIYRDPLLIRDYYRSGRLSSEKKVPKKKDE